MTSELTNSIAVMIANRRGNDFPTPNDYGNARNFVKTMRYLASDMDMGTEGRQLLADRAIELLGGIGKEIPDTPAERYGQASQAIWNAMGGK